MVRPVKILAKSAIGQIASNFKPQNRHAASERLFGREAVTPDPHRRAPPTRPRLQRQVGQTALRSQRLWLWGRSEEATGPGHSPNTVLAGTDSRFSQKDTWDRITVMMQGR